MRRLLLLILLFIATAPFILVGGSITAQAAGEQQADGWRASVTVAAAASTTGCGLSVENAGSHDNASACGQDKGCATCGLCQACHQPGLAGAQLPVVTAQAERSAFPAPDSDFISAERAPGFKPPILPIL
ncbi:MAG: hypothetical protein EOO28_01635 [Comamonadaceae bacterium]|nr:MAG: hypothetical protein EOO28_01635 [Comamonadaceae bacterium]